MIHVKYNKSGKWAITKFVKDHNHPLIVSPREARQTMVGLYFLFDCILNFLNMPTATFSYVPTGW